MTIADTRMLLGTSERTAQLSGQAPELARSSQQNCAATAAHATRLRQAPKNLVPSQPACDPRNVGLANQALELTGAAVAAAIGASRRRDRRGAGSSTLTR